MPQQGTAAQQNGTSPTLAIIGTSENSPTYPW